MATEPTITRYRLHIEHDDAWLVTDYDGGEWVRYEAHERALTAAHAALANLPGHTCHVSGDTCAGCEYAWEREKRIAAAHAARDAATKTAGFLKAELAQLATFNPDWDRLEAANDALREHAATIHELRAQLTTALRERDEALDRLRDRP